MPLAKAASAAAVSRSPEQSEGKRVRRTARKGRLEVRIKERLCRTARKGRLEERLK